MIDVHQHVWPTAFLNALRSRSRAPRLDGATLELAGGERFALATDGVARADGAPEAERVPGGIACVAVSAAWGIDRLPPVEAAELSEAWLDAALALGPRYRVWATAGIVEPDSAALTRALQRGAVGLEVAADVLGAPDGLDRLAPLLEALGPRPLLIHPGPAPGAAGRPGWWVPTVDYVNQLHAAWWAWADGGRARFPRLPVCFVALAGLGPLHGERHRARGGTAAAVDPLTFVETSSYGTRAVDAVIRVLGVDVICRGSDRPYATPAAFDLDPAACHAIDTVNPARLLALASQEVPA